MFELNQLIFYMRNNRVYSAPVLSRMIVENAKEDWAVTEDQEKLYMNFGPAGIFYNTCHDVIPSQEAFGSKQDLLDSL